ncbi:murein hydrolase activator EnvC family protein [Leifsonia sp. AG29]|uniref:murein hydrolase activator EnvC family protein n=1 Tax=Leifsonia sp. AG29 TaxID=2598860 RepID=UPI001E3A30D2|nr:M23 family metallopeptidase [Leifsonia sp. AG29]
MGVWRRRLHALVVASVALASPQAGETLAPARTIAPVQTVASAAVPHGAAPAWRWPVEKVRLVKPYTAPASRYGPGHRGVDLAAEPGEQVLAPADAVVRFGGVVVDRPVVTLDHGGGVLSSYEPVTGSVEVGTPVARGDPIGVLALGGHCDGCVHVGVRVDGA